MDLVTIDEMINSHDPSLRREAATMLAEIGGDETFERLEALLKDPNKGVRDAAQNSFIILGGQKSLNDFFGYCGIRER